MTDRGLLVIPKGHYSENTMTAIIPKGHYKHRLPISFRTSCFSLSEKKVTFRFYYTKGLLFLLETNYYKNTVKR